MDRKMFPELFDLNQWVTANQSRHDEISVAVAEALQGQFSLAGYSRSADATFGMWTLKHLETSIEFNLVPGGNFEMGLSDSESQRIEEIDERSDVGLVDYFPDGLKPVHEVEVSPLLVSRLPLLQWMCDQHATIGDNPGRPDFDGVPEAPVYLDFAEATSVLSRTGFRLLSESECEYVIRAGTRTLFYFGDELPTWEELNEQVCLTRFGKLDPTTLACNRFGLFGLATGTFCSDQWHDDYVGAPRDGSAWVSGEQQSVQVVRGGATSMWPFADAGEWLMLLSCMRLRSDRMYEAMSGVRLASSLP
jgi:formylglycine-generating enzyme required for sulfatase activity